MNQREERTIKLMIEDFKKVFKNYYPWIECKHDEEMTEYLELDYTLGINYIINSYTCEFPLQYKNMNDLLEDELLGLYENIKYYKMDLEEYDTNQLSEYEHIIDTMNDFLKLYNFFKKWLKEFRKIVDYKIIKSGGYNNQFLEIEDILKDDILEETKTIYKYYEDRFSIMNGNNILITIDDNINMTSYKILSFNNSIDLQTFINETGNNIIDIMKEQKHTFTSDELRKLIYDL